MSAIVQQRIKSFQRDKFTFDIIDTGPLDGRPVVLLHGFPETAKSWEQVTNILNQHNFRTFSIQQRGYSLTARPKRRYSYRISELVEDVCTFLKIVDQPVYLISHDWGAVVAGELTRKYPEFVKHLTLISVPHVGAFIKACFKGNQIFKSYYIGLFQIPIIPEFVMKHMPKFRKSMLKMFGMNSKQEAIFEHDFIQENRFNTAINWYRAIPFSLSKDLFKKITVPTLYIWGYEDIALSYAGAKLNKEFFTGNYDEYFIDATHWIPYQNPELVVNYFLRSI